jgi:hypothetical protein
MVYDLAFHQRPNDYINTTTPQHLFGVVPFSNHQPTAPTQTMVHISRRTNQQPTTPTRHHL